METYRQRVEALLKSHKAKLLRKRKHCVWELPDGRKWVTPNTASDQAAWQNNYTDLRLALGFKKKEKTQKDFEHQKKEAFVRKHVRSSNFLGELCQRDVIEAPPPAPLKEERAQLELAQTRLEEEVFPIGGHIPLVIKRGSQRVAGGRTAKAYTFSKEVMARANALRSLEGEKSCKEYLDKIRAGASQKTEKEEEVAIMAVDEPRVVSGGSIESILQEKREDLRRTKQLVQKYQLEVARLEGVVQKLEEALGLTTASVETLRGLTTPGISMSSNGHKRVGTGHWNTVVKEIIGTSPTPLTKADLTRELQKVRGDGTTRHAYQTVWVALHNGWLVEENGIVRLAGQTSQ